MGVADSRSGTWDSWLERESWREGSCAPVAATPAAVALFDANLDISIGETLSAASTSTLAGLCQGTIFRYTCAKVKCGGVGQLLC